ncbi:MAG: hypothetical protein U0R71_18015 [Solirubrobacterales bacterium]
MSILDDAIREHLELKRAHGADEAELKRLEDEAFGPPGRPDEQGAPFAEAPTEFLGPAAGEVAEAAPEGEGGRRMPNLADLQEPPSFPIEDASVPAAEPPSEAPAAEGGEPAAAEGGEPPAAEAPAVEEAPAMEHEAVPAPEAPPAPDEAPTPPPVEAEAPTPPPEAAAPEPETAAPPPEAAPEPEGGAPEPLDAGPSTEEREVIGDQPTQFFDVEAELQAQEPPAEAAPPPAQPPSEELELADEAGSEEYEEDDFFSEQRLSDELNQALEAPVTEEHEALPEHEPLREEPLPEPPPPAAAEPATPPPSPRVEEPTAIYDFEGEAEEGGGGEYEDAEEESGEHDTFEPDTGHEDVLEDTPQFLEESPDDDDLWFEQRPPKDFDFDD